MARAIEYAFTRPDGSQAFHFVDPDAGTPVGQQIRLFMQMEGAVVAVPTTSTEED